MNHHDNGRISELIVRWAKAHTGLVKLFAALPIPVSIPVLDQRVAETVSATIRAAEIIGDQPISAEVHSLITQAVLHWATAYDLIAAYHQMPSERWREQAILLNLQHAAVLALMADEELER